MLNQRNLVFWAVLAILIVVVLWFVPQLQGRYFSPGVPAKEVPALVNEYRRTWAQIIGGFALLLGLYFTWRRVNISERTLEAAQDQQVTERFTRAIDQLGATADDGNPRLEIRLGGIYALERIAKDSHERNDYSETVMEVLTTYVRENARWLPPNEPSSPNSILNRATHWPLVGAILQPVFASGQDQDLDQAARPESARPRADIQAILRVIGRLRSIVDVETILEDAKRIHETRLRERNMIFLHNTNLHGANLRSANLQLAYLSGANLQGASLQAANLQGAFLFQADLRGAFFHDAEVHGASLQGADLRGANFREARGLSHEQIDKWTIGSLDDTKLPEGLDYPNLWSNSIEEQRQLVQERIRSLLGDRGG